jgi:hypothetical protein
MTDVSLRANKKQKIDIIPQYLPMVSMSVNWLQDAIKFAYHNITTLSGKKSYWTKGNCISFLKTCGISNSLINKIILASTNIEMTYVLPKTWHDERVLEKCHYAGMHMLFLGHVKSNFEMLTVWLSNRSVNAMFGKQANLYFDLVKKMRVSKYYSSHNLSTTKWGTGNWVSENYLFFARIQKFMITLPAITKSKLMKVLDNDFILEYRSIQRFITSAHASISRIMSTKEYVKDMDCLIKIYMDCMVEIDRNILKIINKKGKETNSNKKKKINPNFVKSNSLGILSVAKAHDNFGPLILNWEGGFSGERKIQEVKPLLTIKREGADWQVITLRRLYQVETITTILESKLSKINECISKQNRETYGLIKIFGTIQKAEEAVRNCQPLSAVVDKDNCVWIAYRPSGVGTERSSVTLIQIEFKDNEGVEVADICWMSPINLTNIVKSFDSMSECFKIANEYALLLPQLSEDGSTFVNSYYAIGHNWTERKRCGNFEWSNLNYDSVFKDWVTITETDTL